MTEPPEAPPEGVLIRNAAAAAGLSQREAARRATISETRWRQLVSGFQWVDGRPIPTRSRDTTLARMARAVGVSAGQLEDVGREGAAAVIRDLEAAASAADARAAERRAQGGGSPADGRTRVEERWHMLEPVLRQAPVDLDPSEYDALRGLIDAFFEQSPQWRRPDEPPNPPTAPATQKRGRGRKPGA